MCKFILFIFLFFLSFTIVIASIAAQLWNFLPFFDVMFIFEFNFQNLYFILKNVLKISLVAKYCCMSSKYLMNLILNYHYSIPY